MNESDKLQAICKHCGEKFILPTGVLTADDITSEDFPLRATEFQCTHCKEMNTFEKEDIILED